MKKTKHILILLLAFVALGCTNYLDINESPNDPQAEDVNPELILPGALTRPFSTFTITGNRLGNAMMQNWAGDVTSFTGGFTEEYRLDGINNTFYSGIWDGLFSRSANYTAIIDTDFQNYENHRAVALVMRSFYFQYLVDLYGDIPFSEIHQFGDNLTPAYDDAESIYRQLIIDLDEAITLMNNNTPDTIALADADVVFGGNMAMWEKFANTIKLRILVRESQKTNPTDPAYVTTQIALLNGQPLLGAGENVTINPGYSNDSGKQNPYFGAYGEDSGGNATQTNSFTRAAQYAVDFLMGVSPATGIVDDRINGIYAANGSGYTGIVQGESSATASTTSAQLGSSLLIDSTQDGYIMTSSESLFLQAEAAQFLGFNGVAKSYFDQAIQESFIFHAQGIGTYLSDIDSVDGLGWTASADKREAIMTQKWIALNGVNGLESFIEYTRTGYPAVPLATTATRPARFIRLPYPQSEFISNSANVPNQSGDDIFNVPVFWNE